MKKEITNVMEKETDILKNRDTSEGVLQNAEPDINKRMLSLEQKFSNVEEQISLILGFLEGLNKNNLKNTLNLAPDYRDDLPEAVKSESEVENIISDEKSAMIYNVARKELMSELSPLIEYAKKYKAREERDNVIKMMILTEEMKDAGERADELDEIIEKYPALKNSDDIMEKYVTAYVISKGKDAVCSCDNKPDTEELIRLFDENEEFRKAVQLKIREEIKAQGNTPAVSFDGGITALNIEEKPKNMQDAKKATFRLFK